MTKTDASPISSFDPNQVGLVGNQIFGLPFNEDDAKLVLLPVPWDVTVSYRAGSKNGPAAIREASYQVDLYDADYPDAWQDGIAMQEIDQQILTQSETLRRKAEACIAFLKDGGKVESSHLIQEHVAEINQACAALKDKVFQNTKKLLDKQKLVGLIGGDHSTPLGFMQALASTIGAYGILQIDAHCDLREAYEGFQYSHASIMWNALKLKQVEKLVQVGIRDCCQAEVDYIHNSAGRVETFFSSDLQRCQYAGENWKSICERIVKNLPSNVYISFDIDGLDPKLCPNTGTPVPGGLEFEQARYLIYRLVQSGRKIVGFDLNEVSPSPHNDWDANVGARLLFSLCGALIRSNHAV
jgi:agmatinase